MSPVEVIT